jgi:hypothetical protein
MSRQARTWSPLVAFAAAVVAALAMTTGTPDGSLQAQDLDVATPVAEALFIADQFDEQKRNAPGGELPPQF